MPDVRLIDANALIKDIAESIKFADEWEIEAHKKKDKHGLTCAIDTRMSLLAMISRVKNAPTIDAQPVKHGKWEWKENMPFESCSICRYRNYDPVYTPNFCPNCGAYMFDDAK